MDFLDFTAGSDLTKHKVEPKSWMTEKRFVLVTCPDGQTSPLLAQAVDNCIAKGRFALDLETTGLDNRVFSGETRDKIVGVCLSHDGVTGYYVPLRHRDEEGNPSPHNLPMHVFRAEFERLMASPAVAVFHNGKFDQEFLQFNGGKPWREWDKAEEWDDTMILAYLRDTRALQKGLKFLSKTELDMEMIELNELFGSEKKTKNIDYDFSKLDPTADSTLWYACADAICTYLLYEKLYPQVVFSGEGSQKSIYKIEKWCVAATRWMERDRVHIDRAKVAELIDLGQKELFDSLCDVYTTVSAEMGRDITPFYFLYAKEMIRVSNPDLSITSGTDSLQGLLKTCREMAGSMVPETNFPALAKYRGRQGVEKRGKHWPAEYDVMSAQQLGVLLDEMEVQGLERTEKSGQVKTDSDSLDALLEEQGDKVPWLKKIQRFRETQKALSTYLIPLWEDSDPTDDTVKINFNGHKTDTGRFSAPASSDPKKDGGTRFPMHGTPATYDPSRPECLGRIRECIAARPGRLIVAIDFSGEELRIITNLSGEPKWLTEFFRCSSCGMAFDRGDGNETPPAPPPFCPKCGSDKIGDIHTLTALSLYGDDAPKRADWKALRGNAKCVHPDTIIITDKGPRRVGALPLGPVDSFRPVPATEVWGGQSAFGSLLESYNGGTKPLYHVVTRHGLLTCSDQHGFALPDGTVQTIAGGLCEGTDLASAVPPPAVPEGTWAEIRYKPLEDLPEMSVRTTPEMAYFAGLFLGDGTKQGRSSVAICHGDISKTDLLGFPYAQWQQAIMQACTQAGFLPTAHHRRVNLGSRHVMRFLGALDLISGGVNGARNLRVPSWVLESGYTGILNFLGGLADTDGTVLKGGTLSITSKDPIFIGQVAAAAYAVGLEARTEANWNKTCQRYYFRMFLRSSQAFALAPFMRQVKKRARLQAAQPNQRVGNKVLKILPTEVGPCLDIHTSFDDHLYWANGVLTHNSTNFALCYGGSGKAVVRSTGVDDNEGARIKQAFDASYTTLSGWWRRVQEYGRQHGFVLTAFGRKYPVPDIQLPRWGTNAKGEKVNNGGFIAKAERNAVNGPIQGSGADIIKLAMWLVYKECKQRGWMGKISMIATVHDELVFDIDTDILEEAIEVLSEIMCNNAILKALKWRVPLTCDIECGPNWMVQWHITKMLHGKKSWPDELKPYFPKSISGAAAVQSATPAAAAAAAATPGVPTEVDDPKPSNGVYTHVLNGALTTLRAYRLAEVIAKCGGKGTSKLKLTTADGTEIDYGPAVQVNHVEFKVLARTAGL